MEYFKEFLETSTIHGLSHISKTRKFSRIIWTCTIIAGFVFAGYIIDKSFNSWAEYPVKIITETLSINTMRFPKVTVCPPKNVKTNLNFDLMMLENKTLSNSTRFQLYEHAIQLLMNDIYTTNLEYLQKLDEKGRYWNWYHGITAIDIPNYDFVSNMRIDITTCASTGSIRSQYFKDGFNLDKIEKALWYTIFIVYPRNISLSTEDINLNIFVQRIFLKNLEKGFDSINLPLEQSKPIYDETIQWNYKASLGFSKTIYFRRKVSHDDLLTSKLTQVPGFELFWNYSKQIDSDSFFENHTRTRQFLRFERCSYSHKSFKNKLF